MSVGKRGRGGKTVGEERGKGGKCEDPDRQAGRFSPILDDEIHQGQGSLVGDSDGQVQGELSRCLSTHIHTSL